MKTKVLVGITALLTALLVAMVCLFLVLDRKYREQNKANYADDMSYFLECMELEKEWISKQQSKEGAIYLYELEEKTEGSVVPYFACQAALGMLAGNPNKDELDIVGDYLNWHTGELIQSKGMISDYRVVSGELISKGTSDSIDSYVAMYLTLLATFVESEGELDGIEYAEAAVNVCAQRLEELNTKGLTKVAPGKEVYYLMDNVEVLQAYGKILNLLQSGNKAVEKWNSKETLTKFFEDAQTECREAITQYMWNQDEKRFEIGVQKGFERMEFKGYKEFYPYAVAQVYPIACGLEIVSKDDAEVLYERISKVHKWSSVGVEEDFDWPVLAYVAVKLGDVESAERYLATYRYKYAKDRSYPFNTSNAAWAAMAYEELYKHYEEKSNRGLLDLIFE